MENSAWQLDVPSLKYSKLAQNLNVDVCFVGSGITSLYGAYLLAKKGVSVAVVERHDSIGGYATKRSTGKMTAQNGVIYQLLKEDEQLLYYNSITSSINKVLELLSIDCYEKVTSFLYAESEHGVSKLQTEFECYKRLPFTPIASTDIPLPLPSRLAIGMPNMVQIHPVKLTNELAKLAEKEGAMLFTETNIEKLMLASKEVVSSKNFSIKSKHLVVTSHYPLESIRNLYTTKLEINRSYLMTAPTFDLINEHYLNIDAESGRTIRTAVIHGQPHIIYGGGNHLAGILEETTSFYNELKEELKSHFDLHTISAMWSSQDVSTHDSLPYIGQLIEGDPYIHIATGYNKWGLSTSLLAAEIISSSILGEVHSAVSLFSPHRSASSKTIIKQLMQTSYILEQLIGGYLTRQNTPKCTHLGCKTRWNEADQTWDCPCHGSRFSKDGQVLEGPAVYPLKFN